MKRLLNTLLTALILSWLSACDVHQFPEPKQPDNPDNPVNPAPGPDPTPPDTIPEPGPGPDPGPDEPKEEWFMELNLVYAPTFYVWEHLYDPVQGTIEEQYPYNEVNPGYPGTTRKYDNTRENGLNSIHVKIYDLDNGNRCIAEEDFSRINDGESYDTSVELEFKANSRSRVAVWSHLLEHDEALPFYDPTDFNRISLIGSNYQGNTEFRDGFSGVITVTDENTVDGRVTFSHVVPMTRPMGKFEMVTTDLSEFLDKETARRGLSSRASASDYRVVISFPLYYPNSYSLLDDRLENAIGGVSFETRMTVTGESEASLGFEYVMLNDNKDAAVQARVDVYDLDGNQVAGSSTLTIPMRRDHHTLLRGAFLSMDGGGGVGIDPGFNGDHNVTVH